jgi:hypothetical protein
MLVSGLDETRLGQRGIGNHRKQWDYDRKNAKRAPSKINRSLLPAPRWLYRKEKVSVELTYRLIMLFIESSLR